MKDFIYYISIKYETNVIEATLINYVYKKLEKQILFSNKYRDTVKFVNLELFHEFEKHDFPIDIELIINLFELLICENTKIKNGIVFTPKYISDFICKNTIKDNVCFKNIIDPSCGCGIFLISAAEYLHEQTNKKFVEIFNNYIYGIDIDSDNVRRCKIVIDLYVLIKGEDNNLLNINVKQLDSLKTDWAQVFNKHDFDFILGNPPYVNTHDMSKEMSNYLKNTFTTTQNGVYNLYYAFIEYAMDFLSVNGRLGYIVPNNLLSIKSAKELRTFISNNRYIECIVDFTDNMLFKPVRTYSCILFLTKTKKENFKFANVLYTNDIERSLKTVEFNKLPISALDPKGWKLADMNTLENIQKIENQAYTISNMIKTGIATLRDNIYFVEFDGNDFFKYINEKKYIIEAAIVRKIYKISDIDKGCKYIIFPYKKSNGGYEIIDETEFKNIAPSAYAYLLAQKEELDKRDKGKKNNVAWYAYGRSQGLNKYGKKLLFPTFAGYPHFTLVDDDNSLFCNGYAVFDEGILDLSLLQRVLNSFVMHYYVSKTSYPIEGGYYCYQKKYIECFSVPNFTKEEIKYLSLLENDEFDKFLVSKYGLSI